MKIEISSGAEADVADGYWFYERQSIGLGDYFRSCIFVDIESLRYFGGIHEIEYGFHRSLSKRDFLLAFISPLPVIVLRSLPFSIFDANRSGYANPSTTGGRQNKNRTRVADRALHDGKSLRRNPVISDVLANKPNFELPRAQRRGARA